MLKPVAAGSAVHFPRPQGGGNPEPGATSGRERTSALRVAVVILHYNRPADVIESLRRMDALRGTYEFVVVDNGSRPECVAILENAPEMAGVRLLALPQNLGSCAWDIGAVEAGADIAVKLDDDSHLEADSLEVIARRFAAEPDLGALALAVVGGPFPCRDRPSFRRGTAVGFIGCGVAIRLEALRKAGGHDANFFIYADEWDLAIRMLACGYEIDWESRACVLHRVATAGGRPAPRLVSFTVRNEVLIARKYFRTVRYRRLLGRVLLWNLARFRGAGGGATLWLVLRGFWWGLLDQRITPVTLPDADAMLRRYEAWMFAFRPLRRHWRRWFRRS